MAVPLTHEQQMESMHNVVAEMARQRKDLRDALEMVLEDLECAYLLRDKIPSAAISSMKVARETLARTEP